MDARRKEIEHLEADIRRLEQQITSECVEIGGRISHLLPPPSGDEELLKYLNSTSTLRRSIDTFRADIDRIRALTRQEAALGQEIDENSRRRDQLLRDRHSKFMEIGAGSFAVYKKVADREPYRTVFEDLLKLDVESEQRHDELKQLEADEQSKGFFDKIKLKARKVMLRGEISRLDRAKTGGYEQAGAKIVETDFARHSEGALRNLFDTARERKETADTLTLQNDRKLEEIEACRQELKRLDASDRPDDRIRDIEKRIDGLAKELEVMHCWTGQLYLERDLRKEIKEDGLAAKYEIVAGLRESIRKKRSQIDRLKAETEIEEITKKERERRARRKQLEEEMRVKERQIGVLDIEINLGLRRLEELKRVLTGEAHYVEAPPPPLPPLPDMYPSNDPIAPPKPQG